jgi:Holliday junction resolvase
MKSSRYGQRQELKVARQLRGHGAKVTISPGSKGAADVKANFPSGKSWNVQVKSSRTGIPAYPSAKELGRLKISASRIGATPVVARVTQKGISYSSARSRRILKP